MDSSPFIFVGFLVDDNLREALAACQDRDKVFLTDPAYLEILEVEGGNIIGKRLESGAPQDRLDDTARSVASLLSRVIPSFEGKTSDVNVFAIDRKEDPGVIL